MDQKWLETCLTAGEFLYGEFPVSVLQRLYGTRGEKVTKQEIMEFYDESYMMLCDGEMFTPLIATEDPMLAMFKEADKNGTKATGRNVAEAHAGHGRRAEGTVYQS